MFTRAAILAAAVCLLIGQQTAADHNEPRKASSIKGSLVTAYDPCTTIQGMTTGGLPACQGSIRSNPACGFGAAGKGTFVVRAKGSDVALKARLQQLDDGCDGRTLQLRATVRATLEDCGANSCTVFEVAKYPLATCVVNPITNTCFIVAGMNAIRPNSIIAGKRMGIEIIDLEVFDAQANRPSFRAGLLVQ